MDRYICIHGHFYQPPRENAWLEEVPVQDSADPYRDWNERIVAECYAPNGAARILDGQGRIARIINNYARISFNFGPTILAWMEEKAPDAYALVLAADRESRGRFSGHGSALAQAYNHMILPLANRRDKITQIRWGLRDFEHRFGRSAEGLWLPETAVDTETLDLMAGHGMRFAILAPHQAHWESPIDTTVPYKTRLPSGREIALFFYDGPLSRAVAFEKLLDDGGRLAEHLISAFPQGADGPRLAHIATDGETYGHHHAHGDMALAAALDRIQASGSAQLTNYGEFLDRRPPERDVRIVDNSSWSCTHGIERWRENCGCGSELKPGWTQAWRGPLRRALDALRDGLARVFEKEAGDLLSDPWTARDGYIDVILDRSPESLDRFFGEHAARPLPEPDRVRALKWLELQRHAMLMYTSCGWFFSEVSGLETTQVLQYATRAAELAGELTGRPVEAELVDQLRGIPSNLPELKDAAGVYARYVKPARVDLRRIAVHYAVESLFGNGADTGRVCCYDVKADEIKRLAAGKVSALVGRVRASSRVTLESGDFSVAAVYLGEHQLTAGGRPFQQAGYGSLAREVEEAFGRADFPQLTLLLDRHFDGGTVSLSTLLSDQQRRILERVLEGFRGDAYRLSRQLYDHYAPLMLYLREISAPVPQVFRSAAETVLGVHLGKALEHDPPHLQEIEESLREAGRGGLLKEASSLSRAFQRALERALERAHQTGPGDPEPLRVAAALAGLLSLAPFGVDLWRSQNLCDRLIRGTESADPERLRLLAERLHIRSPGVG